MNLLVYPLSDFLSITLPAHHREHSDSQYPRLPPTTKAPKDQQSCSAVTCEHFQTSPPASQYMLCRKYTASAEKKEMKLMMKSRCFQL